jgi:TolB-like protein
MTEDATPAQQKPPPVDRLSQLWRRINQHKMVQWTVAYVAVAYAIQHGVTLTREALEWPQIVERGSLLLLALGLPVVMTFAWYHGERASRHFSRAELTIISLLLVVGSLVFYVFVQPSADTAAREQRATDATRSASLAPGSAISLAVLPFVNLSSDKDQEFFSDGMTEEITAALAKVSGLTVVARTSAFAFKGQNKDVRDMGRALGASHLIEGSVRKAGERVRITAQLVRADTGAHLWTDNYDRDLKDVFAVQEDIAQAIANALRVPLGLKQGESLVSNRTKDLDSYQDYLRARALVRSRGALEPGGPLTEAAKLLEQVVARDPNYAPAWAMLGQAYALTTVFTSGAYNGLTDELRSFAPEVLQKAEAAAQQATRLDPNNVDGYTALAIAADMRGSFVQGEDFCKRALSLDPGNPDALQQCGLLLAIVGRLKDSLALRLRLRAQEPLVPVFNVFTAEVLWESGQNDESFAILKALPPSTLAGLHLAQVYASSGHYSEAADALRGIPTDFLLPRSVEEAIRLLKLAPTQVAPPQTTLRGNPLSFVYLYVGAPDRALDYYENLAKVGYPAAAVMPAAIWASAYAPLRKSERFKAHVRKAGMLDFWKARGWPDMCHPVGADDFVCE